MRWSWRCRAALPGSGTCIRHAAVPPAPPADAAGAGVFENGIGQDIRYAARLLGATPGFTVPAVLTLALGIGMVTAIFSVIDAVLLKPVPYPDAERLVAVWETDRDSSTTREPASLPDLLDFEQRAGGSISSARCMPTSSR